MLTVLKPYAEQVLQPLARGLKSLSPNVISAFGLVFPTLFFLCVIHELYALALAVFVFNALDMLDGMVARLTGRVTAFGGVLDSTIDRFADFAVIAAFGFAGIVSWNIILPLIMVTYLISYLRSRIELAAKAKLSAAVGLMERTERLVLIFVGLALYILFPRAAAWGLNVMELTCLVIGVLSVVTIWQRLVFAYRKLTPFDQR
jgi:archaetidylinositol phosphate synthase